MKHIFLAPDSFKGSISLKEIIKIVSEELTLNNCGLLIESSPLCNGGEGALKILNKGIIRYFYNSSDKGFFWA